MIRKICSLALAILLASAGFLANAQNFSGGLIPLDIRAVYSNATGIKNVSAQVLWSESFAESDEAHELYSAIESYTGNPNEEIATLVSQLKKDISSLQTMRDDIAEGKGGYAGINIPADMKKEYLTELDAQINASKEQLEYYSSMSVPGGADPKMLLEKVLRHSVNHKVYHGVLSLGRGLWAVSESPNEDGPDHRSLGGWGVIDGFGRTVVDFKYDYMIESDEAHGIIKYGTGYRGKGTLYGLLKFNGAQALPCEYDQIYLSEGNYIAAVLPNASHAYLYDWDLNRMPTADICYTEPWTRSGITYYPAIDRNGKVGVYDDSGRLVVPFKYDRCYPDGESWVGVTGPFPKKVTGFGISYDHIDYSNEDRYDISTWNIR